MALVRQVALQTGKVAETCALAARRKRERMVRRVVCKKSIVKRT
jgi:hypothetical protein